MKKVLALVALVIASAAVVAACSGGSSGDNAQAAATAAATTAAAGGSTAATEAPEKPALPIPVGKLKNMTVAKGDVAAGKAAFDENCASCHGAGGKNQGGPGPTIAGVGLKAGQVAYMILNPAAVDPDSGMPKLPLSQKQIADISAYVASLK